MTRYPDLYVLRHGETEWNREGIFQGVHDSPLTAMGREQAAHQGKILDRVISDWSAVDIYSSPQGRAKTTAEIALAGVNRTADMHAALREVDTGDWAGLHISDIIDADPRMANPIQLNGLAPTSHPQTGRGMKFSKPACWRFYRPCKSQLSSSPMGWLVLFCVDYTLA